MRKVISIIIFLLISCGIYAQDIDPNGYNIFYYPNGTISSEGYMRDGKPDSYWKNYYEDGTLKSMGKRQYFQLDSIWNFYNKDGILISAIRYRNDKKNGYSNTYDFYYNEDSSKIYFLSKRELFLNGQKQGASYYYDSSGYMKYLYNYKNNVKSGDAKEFNKDSLPITLFKYYNDYLISRIRINRNNSQGQKHGKWIDFYSNGNKKIERDYFKGKLHGIYREYDKSGKLILEKRYVNGELFIPKAEDEIVLKAEIKKSYFENGKVQYEGAFLNDLPVGIHKEYNEKGKLITNIEYTSESILLGKGMFDTNGKRTGEWKLYDEFYDYYYAIGSYKDGQQTGKWIYYYIDGSVEMEGYFNKGKADREWTWFYPNGMKKREEVYLLGKLEGSYAEYDSEENIIVKGEYFDGDKTGEWYSNIGDITEKGSYELGEKTGEWKHYYNNNNKLRFVGAYRNGDADGTHKWFYSNGNIELIGNYRIGKKQRDWKKYNLDGSKYMTFTYRNDVLVKIDGKKIKRGRGSARSK